MKTRRDEESWSPYGLEALRQEAIRKRRIGLVGIVAVLVVAFLALTSTTSQTETEIFGNGQKQSLELEVPQEEEQRGPDARVSVSPGRIVAAPTGPPAPEAQPQNQGQSPARDLGEPIDWMGLLLFLGPVALVGTVLWGGFRPRAAPVDEVNFGVYKGAMPLEMITASHAHLVVTHKQARRSLFGKRHEDFVPRRNP